MGFRILPLILLAVLSQAATCGPGFATEPDTCDLGSVGAISELELGVDGGGGTFLPLRDMDHLSLVQGSQGGLMIEIVLRVHGANLPHCLEQSSTIENSEGVEVGGFSYPLNTYEDGENTRSTSPTFITLNTYNMPVNDGDVLTIRSEVGDQETSRTVIVGYAQ